MFKGFFDFFRRRRDKKPSQETPEEFPEQIPNGVTSPEEASIPEAPEPSLPSPIISSESISEFADQFGCFIQSTNGDKWKLLIQCSHVSSELVSRTRNLIFNLIPPLGYNILELNMPSTGNQNIRLLLDGIFEGIQRYLPEEEISRYRAKLEEIQERAKSALNISIQNMQVENSTLINPTQVTQGASSLHHEWRSLLLDAWSMLLAPTCVVFFVEKGWEDYDEDTRNFVIALFGMMQHRKNDTRIVYLHNEDKIGKVWFDGHTEFLTLKYTSLNVPEEKEPDWILRRITKRIENTELEDYINLPWGKLYCGVYGLALSAFSDVEEMSYFLSWLGEQKGFDRLAEASYQVSVRTEHKLSVMAPGEIVDLIFHSMPSDELNIYLDDLYKATEFDWILKLVQKSHPTNSELFLVRFYAELSEMGPKAAKTRNYIKEQISEYLNLNIDLLRRNIKPIRTSLTAGTASRTMDWQRQQIEQLLAQEQSKFLEEFGFKKIDELLQKKNTKLRACLWAEPPPSRKATFWPLSCDIKDGTAIETDVLIQLRQDEYTQDRILLLYGPLGAGKTTTALMYANEWKGVAYYFGVTGKNTPEDLIQQYQKLDVDKIIQSIFNIPNLLLIFDDIQLGLDVVNEFVKRFEEDVTNNVKLLLLSNTFPNYLSDAGTDLFSKTIKVKQKVGFNDIDRLIKVYWPENRNYVGQQSPLIPEWLAKHTFSRDILENIRKRTNGGDWVLLHLYLIELYDEQYMDMERGIVPSMGKGKFLSRLFEERLKGFSQEELIVFCEACALSSLQISILPDYFESSQLRKDALEKLKKAELILPYIKDGASQKKERGVYRFYLSQQAHYYLEAAETMDKLVHVMSPALDSKKPTKDEFVVEVLTNYLLTKPANYSEAIYFALYSHQQRIVRQVFSHRQPWHAQLMEVITNRLSEETGVLRFGSTLRLLRMVNRNLPNNILQSPNFEKREIQLAFTGINSSFESPQLGQYATSLRLLRQADRRWTREFIEEILNIRSAPDVMLKAPLRPATRLLSEIYRVHPVLAKKILTGLDKKEFSERILNGLIHNPDAEENTNTSVKFAEVSLVLHSLASFDHHLACELLDLVGFQPFKDRLQWYIDPLNFAHSMHRLFQVYPSFVRNLFEELSEMSDIMGKLSGNFFHRRQNFSRSMNAFSVLSQADHPFASSIFNQKETQAWAKRFVDSLNFTEFNNGLRALNGFAPRTAVQFLEFIGNDKLANIMSANFKASNISRLILTIVNIDPTRIEELFDYRKEVHREEFDLILDQYRWKLPKTFNQSPSFQSSPLYSAYLLSGLSHLPATSEYNANKVWDKLKNDVVLQLKDPKLYRPHFGYFFNHLKQNLEVSTSQAVAEEIAALANQMLVGPEFETILFFETDPDVISDLVNGFNAWADRNKLTEVILRNEDFFLERLDEIRDINDLGKYLLALSNACPAMRQTIIERLNWGFILDEINTEFNLGRVVLLLLGLAGYSPIEGVEAPQDGAPKSASRIVINYLMELEDFFSERIDDEPNLGIIISVMDALNRTVKPLAQTILTRIDYEILLDKCFAEPRVGVISNLIAVISRTDPIWAARIIDGLAIDTDSLTIKLLGERNLGYLGIHIRRLHNPEYTQDPNRQTTALKVIRNPYFDSSSLSRRLSTTEFSSKNASFLYNLTQVDEKATRNLLKPANFEYINEKIKEKKMAILPGHIALLFAENYLQPDKAGRFAKFILEQGFTSQFKNVRSSLLFCWALRELSRATSDVYTLEHQFDWKRLAEMMKNQWRNRDHYVFKGQRLTTWELGWCLWALHNSLSSKNIIGDIQNQILEFIPSKDLFKDLHNATPTRRAFGLLGFGEEFAVRYPVDWSNFVTELCEEEIPDAVQVLLSSTSRKATNITFKAIAKSYELPVMIPEIKTKIDQSKIIDNVIWGFAWKWFDLRDFED